MTLLRENDTIAAVATPLGPGGIGIVRVSGELSPDLFNRLFRPARPIKSLQSHRLYYGWFVEPETGNPVDEVLAVLMRAPHSYTAEDVLEIQCHSGPAILHRILETLLSCGARLADPGEFTRRAFLNGRIDLAQAEAVAELASARSHTAGRLALSLLQGRLSERVHDIRNVLKDCLASIEAAIDYPEEDIDIIDEHGTALRIEDGVIKPVEDLISEFTRSRPFRHGAHCLIAGKPNAGKSSLLNALLCEDRAIVTPIPGTTRDPVEAELLLKGIAVRFTDTAGIRSNPDRVEAIGIEKAEELMKDADVILWLVDASGPVSEDDIQVGKLISSCSKFQDVILTLSKIDRAERDAADMRLREISELFPQADTEGAIKISSKEGRGIKTLEERVSAKILASCGTEPPEVAISERHREVLSRVLSAAKAALNAICSNMSPEIAAIELRNALTDLSEVTGQGVTEDVLDRLFSNFCLGK